MKFSVTILSLLLTGYTAHADIANVQNMSKYRCSVELIAGSPPPSEPVTTVIIYAKDAEAAVGLSQIVVASDYARITGTAVFSNTIDLTFAKPECKLVP